MLCNVMNRTYQPKLYVNVCALRVSAYVYIYIFKYSNSFAEFVREFKVVKGKMKMHTTIYYHY